MDDLDDAVFQLTDSKGGACWTWSWLIVYRLWDSVVNWT